MHDNIMVGRYYPNPSKIHSLYPATKMICLLFYIIMLVCSDDVFLFLISIGILIVDIILSRVPFRIYANILWNCKTFFIVIFLLRSVFHPDIFILLSFVVKFMLFLLYVSMITLTTAPTEITYGLEKTLKPLQKLKIKINKLALQITNLLRFVPLLLDNKNKIRRAYQNRGIELHRLTLYHKFFVIKEYLFRPYQMAYQQLKSISKMMKIRLYSEKEQRTNYRLNPFGFLDILLITMHVLVLVFLLLSGMFL